MFTCDVCGGRAGPQAVSLRTRLLRGVLRLALCDWQLATVGDLDRRFTVEACDSPTCADIVFVPTCFSVCRSGLEFRITAVELRWRS